MKMVWTESQLQRLKELKAGNDVFNKEFKNAGDRNRTFLEIEKQLVKVQRALLQNFQKGAEPPALCALEETLSTALMKQGFSRITTPTIMSKGLLEKMSVTKDHPLFSQVFWLDSDRCMRPMLAPHLYYVLVDLLRLWKHPVRIFEIGMCYRKETKGARHAGEFTMCNLVEMGIDPEEREERLDTLAALVTGVAGIGDYHLDVEQSAVYGDTIDVIGGQENLELGSAAFGPHPLDESWKIDVPWVGIGFGLERLLMASRNSTNITPWKRSLTYVNGIKLNI
jgi:pyrrolysyl-tRNA synthetase-like protein